MPRIQLSGYEAAGEVQWRPDLKHSRKVKFLPYLAMAAAILGVTPHVRAQDSSASPAASVPPATSASSYDKWDTFKNETLAPIFVISSVATAGVSQALRSDPEYGAGGAALAKRFGAAAADNVSQNYFSDYVLASILHEDTRYRRRGEKHGFWSRFGYAVTRAFVTRTDAGGSTANWANILGSGVQAGLSNVYYPAPSRNLSATAINWANSISAAGFGNLFPEFFPDFKRFLKRLHL